MSSATTDAAITEVSRKLMVVVQYCIVSILAEHHVKRVTWSTPILTVKPCHSREDSGRVESSP